MHAQRANYQAYTWCHALEQFPNVQSPEGHDWKLDEGGIINYEWTSRFIVPQELIDMLCVEPSETRKEEKEGDEDLSTEAD